MAEMRHLLIGSEPHALERWKAAFPAGEYASPGGPAKAADVVWMWLQIDQPALPQIQRFVAQYQAKPLVVLTNLPVAADAIAALKLGVRAYCNAQAGPATFRQIAQVVEAGGIWLGEDLAQFLLMNLAAPQNPMTRNDQGAWRQALSQREIEVAEAVANGASNKVIARQLGITERTVKAHITTIFQKLGVHDRLQLALKVTGGSSGALASG